MRSALGRLLTQRFTRRALAKPNLVYFTWRFVANGVRAWRRLGTSVSYHDIPAIAQELCAQGIVTGPSDRFLTSEGRQALAEAASTVLRTSQSQSVQAIAEGAARSGKKSFLVNLVKYPKGVPADSPLLKVALDEKLLEIVSSYLGLWPCLHSIAAWLNYPTDAPASTSQLWHCDPEDLKIIKVFIYLVDVDERCGPFTYIPGTHSFGAQVPRLHALEMKQRVTDNVMARAFPPSMWRVCTGGANTMILADTIGYHRGGRPDQRQRVLITFTYTSGTPRVDPLIRIAARPPWISAGIQHAALTRLLQTGPRPDSGTKKKKEKNGGDY